MKKTLIALAAAAFALPAAAQSEFSFSYLGTTTHWIDQWECPNTICAPGAPPVVVATWSGIFSIFTDASTDGLYAGDHLRIKIGETMLPRSANLPFPTGEGLHATLASGRLSSMSGSFANYVPNPDHYTTDGTTYQWNAAAEHHYGPTTGSATLTPISPAPEPETWAMLAAGAAILAARRRNRRAS